MNAQRRLVLALMAGALTAPFASFAQQPAKSARIGFLAPASPQVLYTRLQAFRDGLRELGYVEGKNLQLEVRWGEGKLERLPTLADELVQAKVDVIVAATSPAVVAARQATQTVPIVMPVSSDPVGDGLVASLARPGGNITGLSMMAPELGQKRLPVIYESSDFVDVGGLISYGPNINDMYRRSATYVDKILRGAKPADLPVEQPTKFELAVNLRAARALGIEFPESILLRADKVIE